MQIRSLTETLENRTLFAVTLTDGVLTIEGTDAADTVALTARATTLTVRVNADRTMYNLADVSSIVVNSHAGNDRISLGKLAIPAIIDAGAGNDRVTGGRGDDVITGGNGDDILHGGAGDDQLFGEAGNDRLFGDAGDDDLDGGDDFDSLNGGSGTDTAADSTAVRTGMEDDNDGNPVRSPYVSAGFNNLTPLDTTGFNVQPGTNVISPLLATNPAGNQVFFNPNLGVVIQNGGAFVLLPGTGAYARELGAKTGNTAIGWYTGD